MYGFGSHVESRSLNGKKAIVTGANIRSFLWCTAPLIFIRNADAERTELPSPAFHRTSLDCLPNEVILLIFNYLAPHDIFRSFGYISRRYHHLVPRVFPPDGRAGILVELVDRSNIVRFGTSPNGGERMRLGSLSRFRFVRAWAFVNGRKVVADHPVPLNSNVDFGAIAEAVSELGNFVFVGVGGIGIRDGTAQTDWIISLLSNPVSAPKKFSLGEKTALEMLSMPQLSFLRVSNLDVSFGASFDVPQHLLTQQPPGMFPSCETINVWSASTDCVRDVAYTIRAITGANPRSRLSQIVMSFGTGERHGHIFISEIPLIMALRNNIGWIALPGIGKAKDATKRARYRGISNLRNLELHTDSVPRKFSSLLEYAQVLSIIFPSLDYLILVFHEDVRPEDMCRPQEALPAFVDFVATQPAKNVYLRFYLPYGRNMWRNAPLHSAGRVEDVHTQLAQHARGRSVRSRRAVRYRSSARPSGAWIWREKGGGVVGCSVSAFRARVMSGIGSRDYV
ncbi:hypothetical protein M427DRAFT_44867 [Gonapodya prolifera JEL478]|uniref:F-box domain-containing protein n=1 Tax=Gonapodya prolifera (strain JEL478) TaxID=1344416 RepID=A0A139ACW6_GONPJ|nr:hypothetical protein M427DRAFT_44867 [Gonapodya prolifera JEL478]|eukprot:KXS14666.1 hypothetical protein M427DRAFT_44867 [Gonapodya prolifera JEL478]